MPLQDSMMAYANRLQDTKSAEGRPSSGHYVGAGTRIFRTHSREFGGSSRSYSRYTMDPARECKTRLQDDIMSFITLLQAIISG